MLSSRRRLRLAVPALLSGPALALSLSGVATAAPQQPSRPAPTQLLTELQPKVHTAAPHSTGGGTGGGTDGGPSKAGGEADEGSIADRAAQYAAERSAPGTSVSAAALLAARQQAAALPQRAGHWKEQTDQPYQAQPDGYTDPVWSNAGAGFDIVGGRTTALAHDGHELYAATAGGGVWVSSDSGQRWKPLSDDQPSMSTGALAVNPADHTVWIGTGEANTNADSYLGAGVFRVATNGSGKPRGALTPVGGSALVDSQVYRLVFDGPVVFAATSRGLYRTSSDGLGSWTRVLAPSTTVSPYVNHITDVAVRPGSGGARLVAVNGYRDGSPDNGFFASSDGGSTWTRATPTGALDGSDIGRTTLAYAGDARLYALMESPKYLAAGKDASGSATNLKGLFVSRSGDPAGPWTQLADSAKLQASGSAIRKDNSAGYNVGVQSWYNQALVVDPADPDTLFVSLEEVFKTKDGGKTFTTPSPYWDYGLACGTSCPKTTHPDQHALLITDDARVVIGNDGGVYSRPVALDGYGGWTDLNATLHDLQFYDASAGRSGRKGRDLTFWGGLQDNGTAVVPEKGQAYAPAGGDGFNVIVDPADASRAVGEYTNGATYLTTDGGHTFVTASPTCPGQDIGIGKNRPDCDDLARFQTPLVADPGNSSHWLLGGQYVWDTTAGWSTRCDLTACDWKRVFDLGTGHAATAVATAGGTSWAAWVAGGNPSPSFSRGIATNAGGSWHQVDVSSLPNRYIAGVTVDKNDGRHAYAVFNGYSRRWIPGGGTGVVFETRDGGATWTDLTGNLPDAPGDALVVRDGLLVLATDVGVFGADLAHPTAWSRLGTGLPNAPTNNLTIAPTGAIVAATHGRGIWTLR